MDRIRIAYITSEFPPDTGFGGIGTYSAQIAKLMLEKGYKPVVFTASFTRGISEYYKGYQVHRIFIKNFEEFKSLVVRKFIEIHRKKPFHVIECPEIGGEAIEIKREFPEIPLIVRIHAPSVLITKLQNTYTPFCNKLRYVISSFFHGKLDLGYWSKYDKNQNSDPDYLITSFADIITTPSNAMKKWAIEFWKIRADRIKVIPNPYIPSPEFLKISSNSIKTKRITFVGRLNVLKGLVTLTKAIPFVLKKNPDWKIRFIGKNENSHVEGKDMRSWMKEELSSFLNAIEFIDWVEYSELPRYYSDSEICVFPSLFESYSYVCAEAMAAGKAIIGSEQGGMSELLSIESGKLVNPFNAKVLARTINELISKPSLREKYGTCARKRILDEYSVEIISEQICKLYQEVIK